MTGIITMFVISNVFLTSVRAIEIGVPNDKTLKVGSFNPATSTPTPTIQRTKKPIDSTPNAECLIQDAENRIAKHGGGQINQRHKMLMEEMIRIYLSSCTDSGQGCTKDPAKLSVNVAEKRDLIKQMSDRLFANDSWIYAKTLAAYAIRQGFGLSEKGLADMISSLGKDCGTIADKLTQYVKTPLYLYPPKDIDVSIKIGGASPLSILALKNGTLRYQGETYGSLSYEYVYSKNLEYSSGRVIEANFLAEELFEIGSELNFTDRERKDFVRYWTKTLPKADYYEVSLLNQDEARSAASWTVTPVPDSEIRYIFTFKPLLKKPENIKDLPFTPLIRTGFTAVDIGGIILF